MYEGHLGYFWPVPKPLKWSAYRTLVGLGSPAVKYTQFLYSQHSKFFPPASQNGEKRQGIAGGGFGVTKYVVIGPFLQCPGSIDSYFWVIVLDAANW